MEAQICQTCKHKHNVGCTCAPNSVCEKYEKVKNVQKKTWKEFRESGMLWWINMILHTFGWAICCDVEEDGTVTNAYPARVRFRGFAEESNTNGYIKVAKYLSDNASDLLEEAKY